MLKFEDLVDQYALKARIYPAIIISFPTIIFYYFQIRPEIVNFISYAVNTIIFADIPISLVLVYLIAQLSRYVSKEIYEKIIFQNGLNFPTTDLLMSSDNTFPEKYKEKIFAKTMKDFGIELPNENLEITNEMEYRKNLNALVGLIRNKVGKGKLTFQHNMEYGFIRNLIGGSLISLFLSMINLIIFGILNTNYLAFSISSLSFIFYLILLMNGDKIIKIYGKDYAEELFRDYLNT